MTTHVIEWINNDTTERKPVLPALRKAKHTASYAAKVFSILVIAIVVNGGVFAALTNPTIAPMLHAALALSGFVFLALAIDEKNPMLAWSLAATGVILPILAGFSSTLNPVITIIAAALLVLWITASILRR